MSKNQFTGTATQLQRNRKLCQFNKDQYCTTPRLRHILMEESAISRQINKQKVAGHRLLRKT